MTPKRIATVALLLASATGIGVWYWRAHQPPPPPPPERQLFERSLPSWILARAAKDLSFENERALELAKPWPTIVEALQGIDKAWPRVADTKSAVARLNAAARAAGLAYWVDVIVWRDTPYLLTYEVLARSRWHLHDHEKELLRVRRLDHINIEMGYLGHAGADQPVVLVDRLEPNVLDSLEQAFAEKPAGNAINKSAIAHWRKAIEEKAGVDALAKAAAQVKRRDALFDAMRGRLKDGTVIVPKPDRLEWGEDFFDLLKPATSTSRRGGPLLLSTDVRDLRNADRALRDGEGRRALDVALELECEATEAHEARHALDPSDPPIPDPLLIEAGEDEPEFARAAERELRAYLGQLHDAESPPCITVTRLAVQAGGARARETPHHFAGMILLETLSPTGPEDLPALIDALCTLPEAEVRRRAEIVYKSLYGQPFEAAHRVAESADGGVP